jgi:ketosteroid isomerase-like protein
LIHCISSISTRLFTSTSSTGQAYGRIIYRRIAGQSPQSPNGHELKNSRAEKRMKTLPAALALLPLASMSATASDEADVRSVLHQWSASFNSGDSKTVNSTCAANAIVLDDFPPHVWQGPAACSRWFKDFQAYAAKAAITDANIVEGKTAHLEFDSGYAYLVASVTLSFRKSGKPVTATGVITMALHKGGAGWLITGFARADQ